ncbi:hypothetical protein ILUMI_25498 [Ignelater luminosus]|uniref:Uncharacterized protein n=1 Tax=Ignelater luminosus TaxID=2038154 RepID=A0A8K0G005_IGNLU|nr:hypothetical protein ILUMI_25498 [Ignelater luminosus]
MDPHPKLTYPKVCNVGNEPSQYLQSERSSVCALKEKVEREFKALEGLRKRLGITTGRRVSTAQSTPLVCGKFPSELYSKTRIRIKLDLLQPPPQSHARPTSVGDRVQARWCPATPLPCEPRCLKRHYNQLLRVIVNNPQPKKVVLSPLPLLTVPVTLPMDEPDQLQPESAEVPEGQPFPQPIPRCLARVRRAPRKLQN